MLSCGGRARISLLAFLLAHGWALIAIIRSLLEAVGRNRVYNVLDFICWGQRFAIGVQVFILIILLLIENVLFKVLWKLVKKVVIILSTVRVDLVIIAILVDSDSNIAPAGSLDIDCVPIGAVITTIVSVLSEESTTEALIAHELRRVYLLVLIWLLITVRIYRPQYIRQLLNVVQVWNITHSLCGLLLNIILCLSPRITLIYLNWLTVDV